MYVYMSSDAGTSIVENNTMLAYVRLLRLIHEVGWKCADVLRCASLQAFFFSLSLCFSSFLLASFSVEISGMWLFATDLAKWIRQFSTAGTKREASGQTHHITSNPSNRVHDVAVSLRLSLSPAVCVCVSLCALIPFLYFPRNNDHHDDTGQDFHRHCTNEGRMGRQVCAIRIECRVFLLGSIRQGETRHDSAE